MSYSSVSLHLFSSPGPGDELDWIVDAARPYLEDRADGTVAYLPFASLYGERFVPQTEDAFRGLARIETINAESMELAQMEAILRRATLAYIPGGNTFLLNHRLRISQLFPFLRKKLEAGLPLVAFSAGTVLCGPNILTSNDLNMPATTYLEGLHLTPFNFNVHYDDEARRDNWLIDYQAFHDNPVILMEDGSYITIRGKMAKLVRGRAWIWRAGREKERLDTGSNIDLHPEVQNR